MFEIAKGICVDEDDLVFQASRSSGPGGQNVNKVSTRMTVLFDVTSSKVLSADQKSRILGRLRNRATSEGSIRVTCQSSRSQASNRQAAIDRLAELLREALVVRTTRKPTKTPYRAKVKRLEGKARRGNLKRLRSAGDFSD
jgi:ribosome-associated protein